MLAAGTLSPIETARAKLQEKIADFLAARARLIRLMSNPSLTIQGQAQGLYAIQLQLENTLQNDMMPRLNKVSSGAWDLSDVLQIGNFTAQIVSQIGSVNKLESQAGVGGPQPLIDTTTMAIGVPALIVLGLVSGYLVARR